MATKIKLLFVDHYEEWLSLVQAALKTTLVNKEASERFQFSVEVYTNLSDDVMARAKFLEYDLVFLSFEFAEKIVEDIMAWPTAARKRLVILMPGTADMQVVRKYLKLGVTDAISKPYDEKSVHQLVLGELADVRRTIRRDVASEDSEFRSRTDSFLKTLFSCA